MDRMLNPDLPRPAVVATQLGLVYAVGTAVPVGMVMLTPLVLYGWHALLAAALAGWAAVVVVLYAIANATPAATILGRTQPRRMLWALLVGGFGTPMLALGWIVVSDAGGLLSRPAQLALSGVPHVVFAGLLVRHRLVSAGSALGLVGLIATGLVVVQHADDIERLRAAGLDRNNIMVATVPNYKPTTDQFGGDVGSEFLPADPADIPPTRYITIVAYDVTYARQDACGQAAGDGRLSFADCEPESGGMVYRHGAMEHGYQVRRGDDIVEILGSLAVDRTLLRNAALTVHVTTAAETEALYLERSAYTAVIPGFQAHALGIPPGVGFEPSDPAQLRTAVVIRLTKQFYDRAALCFRATCDTAGPDLLYVHQNDGQHAYVHRRGDMAVIATGGISVDREVLKQVALDARPPTDAEVLHSLPPHPRYQGLKSWLRKLRVSW